MCDNLIDSEMIFYLNEKFNSWIIEVSFKSINIIIDVMRIIKKKQIHICKQTNWMLNNNKVHNEARKRVEETEKSKNKLLEFIGLYWTFQKRNIVCKWEIQTTTTTVLS